MATATAGTSSGGPVHAVLSDIVLNSTEAFYFGEKTTDGTWRIMRSANNLVIQRLESGVWVTKSTISS